MTNGDRIRQLQADIHDAKARLNALVYADGEFDPAAAMGEEARALREKIGACTQMIRRFEMEERCHQ